MSEITNDDKMRQRAYNYMLIMKIWKCLYKSYGENKVIGNEYNFNSIYAVLERSKDTLRTIVNCEGNFDEKAIIKNAVKVEAKTGISRKYLIGEEIIDLHGKLNKDKIMEYIDNKETVNEITSKLEDEINKHTDKKITNEEKREINKIHKSMTREKRKELIEKKNDFEEKFDNKKEILNQIEIQIKNFEDALKKDINSFLEKSDDKETNQDKSVFNLKYFLKNKKRFDAISVQSIHEIMEMMQRTGTWDLFAIRTELKGYIEVLEKQLELAKAVYVVALDTGDIKDQ